MPKASHATTSRRRFLAGAAAVAAISPAAVAAPVGDDARLIDLAQQIEALWEREQRASDECTRTGALARTMLPERPHALLWRFGDPVAPDHNDRLPTEGGAFRVWTQAQGVRALAKAGDAGNPRAAELIEAQARYDAEVEDVYARSGYTAAESELERLSDASTALFEQMLLIEPVTIEGYRALARALINTCWCGEINPGDPCLDSRGIAAILSRLSGMPSPFAEDAPRSAQG